MMSPLAKRLYTIELNLNNYAHYAENEMGIDADVLNQCMDELREIREEVDAQYQAKVPKK